jgi:hypothetical protein
MAGKLAEKFDVDSELCLESDWPEFVGDGEILHFVVSLREFKHHHRFIMIEFQTFLIGK